MFDSVINSIERSPSLSSLTISPPCRLYYTTFSVKNQQYFSAQDYRSNFVCAKRNFIGRKPTSLRSTSFARSATSFICAAGGNDVLALLEMMLRASTQMMLCPADTNEKIQVFRLGFFGRGRRARTHDPRFWRPVLYQLSYTPVFFRTCVLYHTFSRFAIPFLKKVSFSHFLLSVLQSSPQKTPCQRHFTVSKICSYIRRQLLFKIDQSLCDILGSFVSRFILVEILIK